MMNYRVTQPDRLIDISIDDLQGCRVEKGIMRIGAMTRYVELQHADIDREIPLLARVLPYIAHDAIRNRGTVGGSLGLSDPAAELPALALALNGTIDLACQAQTRSVSADDFFHGVYETECREDEVITALNLPCASDGDRFGFHELARRHATMPWPGSLSPRRPDRCRARCSSASLTGHFICPISMRVLLNILLTARPPAWIGP